jgi:hypothetical protein
MRHLHDHPAVVKADAEAAVGAASGKDLGSDMHSG